MYIVPLKKAKEFFYKSLFLLTPSPTLVSTVLKQNLNDDFNTAPGGRVRKCVILTN